MAEFEYHPTFPFRSYMGIYNAEQIRAQRIFLELIEVEAPAVLKTLRNDIFPKVPKDILRDAENHLILTFTGSEWIVEAALQHKRENGELSAIPAIVRQDELRDALVRWANRFNMNHPPPDMVSPLDRAHRGKPPALAESTFWFFQVACDTLSQWIKEMPEQLKWTIRAKQPAPLLRDITEPFIFTHPMPLPRSNGSEFIEMLKGDVIEHFDRSFRSYLEHLEALNKAPTTYGEIQVRYAHEVDKLSAPDPTVSYIDDYLEHEGCIADIRVAKMIRQYLFPVPEPAPDTPLPMAPVYLDPFVFRHQGIKLDSLANMELEVENLVKEFDLALNERLGYYHSIMNHEFDSFAHVGNREPLIITLDGWNPLIDQDRTAARKRLLEESQRQIDAHLERQEKRPDVAKKKAAKSPDAGYLRLIEHVIKCTPLTDIAEDLDLEPDSILRSIRPLAHTLGISLRDSVVIKDISLLNEALENRSATLIMKHDDKVISLTWASKGDLTFLQKNGYEASRISRLLRAIEECYYQGHQLPDKTWQKMYSLSRDRWRSLYERVELEGGFFLPRYRKEQNLPLRGVLCVDRFLNGEHLEEILASLWIDEDLWEWYWHGFLRSKLTQSMEGFPAELVSGWTKLWDSLNISSEKIDELTNLIGSKLVPSTKTTPTLPQDQCTIFYPLVDMVDSVDRITAIPFSLAESLNQRIRGVIASVRKNKLRIRLSELYFLLAFSPNDDHIIEPSFSDVLIK